MYDHTTYDIYKWLLSVVSIESCMRKDHSPQTCSGKDKWEKLIRTDIWYRKLNEWYTICDLTEIVCDEKYTDDTTHLYDRYE